MDKPKFDYMFALWLARTIEYLSAIHPTVVASDNLCQQWEHTRYLWDFAEVTPDRKFPGRKTFLYHWKFICAMQMAQIDENHWPTTAKLSDRFS